MRRKQAAKLVHEDILARRVIGPRGIKRHVVGEATNIEWPGAKRNNVLCQVAGEMLGGRGGTAVARGVHPALAVVTIQKHLLRFGNGGAIQA